jgi:hypothetical protein
MRRHIWLPLVALTGVLLTGCSTVPDTCEGVEKVGLPRLKELLSTSLGETVPSMYSCDDSAPFIYTKVELSQKQTSESLYRALSDDWSVDDNGYFELREGRILYVLHIPSNQSTDYMMKLEGTIEVLPN